MSLAFFLARGNVRNSIAPRIGVIPITKKKSIKVKAFALRAFLLWKWEFTEYRERYSKAVITSIQEFAYRPAVARGAFRSSLSARVLCHRWQSTRRSRSTVPES